MKNVSVKKINTYDQSAVDDTIKYIIDNIGGIEKFVKRNTTVFLKANLVNAMSPNKGGTTHPSVIVAIAKLCKSVGATVIVGDGCAGPNSKRYVNNIYKKCGYLEMEKVHDIQLNRDLSYSIINYDGAVVKSIPVLNAILNTDTIINVAKFKSHKYTGFTGACKNMYGAIPGLVKMRWHQHFPNVDSFALALHDIHGALDKIPLHIMDGIIGMEGEGPIDGTPINVGVVMASTCYSTLDQICIKIIDRDPNDFPTLKDHIHECKIIGDDITDIINPNFNCCSPMQQFKVVPNPVARAVFNRMVKTVTSKKTNPK